MKPFMLFSVILGTIFTVSVQAGVVEDRKANFKNNVTILKAIKGQIQAGNFDSIAAGGQRIADWASQMPDFFPQGSESKGALKAIWMDFDDFRAKAEANRQAALKLQAAAGTADAGKIMAAVQGLSGTCKSCHQSYKAN